jgi:microfibrillar-associated protein 1
MSALLYAKHKEKEKDRDLAPFIPEKDKEKKIGVYRPGKAPQWAGDDEQDETAFLRQKKERVPKKETTSMKIENTGSLRRPVQAQVIVGDKPDADASSSSSSSSSSNRPIAAAAILTVPEPEQKADDDGDAEARRERARKKFLMKKESEDAMQDEDDKPKVEEKEESEYETDSDDDEPATSRPLFKPVFVSKKGRETLDEAKRIEAEEEQLEEDKKKRQQERKVETKQIVLSEMKKDQEEQLKRGKVNDSDEDMPDDNDNLNEDEEEAEAQAWKLRELLRIKRDREERQKMMEEAAATAARRLMTDDEILKMTPAPEPKTNQYRFLQKYYHSGGFYRNEDDPTFQRDFTAPTGADRTIDRTLLPKVLQVKKFGLKGRTKYTHLVDQDTTTHETNPWLDREHHDAKEVKPYKLAGTGSIFDKFKKKAS